MSRPVKISDTLYRQLQKTAHEQDIPLQEALKRVLDSRSLQIRQLGSERTRLQKQLRQAEQDFQAESDTSQKARRDMKALRLKLDGIQRQLDERTFERDKVLSLCEDWKRRSDEVESELEQTQESAKKEKTQYQAILVVLSLLAIFVVGFMVWTDWREMKSTEQEQPPDAQLAFQPWSYGV